MCFGKNGICMTCNQTFHGTKYGKTKQYQWKVPRKKFHLNTHIKSFHLRTSGVRHKLQNSKYQGLIRSDKVLWTVNNKRVCHDEEYIRITDLHERKNYKHNPRSRDESMAITAFTKTWSFWNHSNVLCLHGFHSHSLLRQLGCHSLLRRSCHLSIY